MHPVAENGRGFEESENHTDDRKRGHSRFPVSSATSRCKRHIQGAVCRSREVQDLRRLRRRMPDGGAQRIRRGTDRPPRYLHPVRASHSRQLLLSTRSACLGLNPVVCGKCKEACEAGAINYDVKPKTADIEVGAIVVATGFDLYDKELARRIRPWPLCRRARRHPVRAAVLGLRPDGRPCAAPVRPEGAEERRLHPVLRLARPRTALRLLLEDLLHVHRQARDAVQAPCPRRPSLRLLY